MKKRKRLVLLPIILLMIIGVCGCMPGNKDTFKEAIRSEALTYLNENYSDSFTVKGYLAPDWAYDYSTVTFESEKYPALDIEVRVYKNSDGSLTFKDNYYHCFMAEDAITYCEKLYSSNEVSFKIRFFNTIWSDELDGAKTFDDWVNNGTCAIDIFVISKEQIAEDAQRLFVERIAADKIGGSITFFATDDADLLKEKSLDDVLNNQHEFVTSKEKYYINSDFEIEVKEN